MRNVKHQMTNRNLVRSLQRLPLLPLFHQRQLDKTCLTRSVVDTLRSRSIIRRLGPKDIRYEGLRIAIVEWEPTRLALHHDSVPRQKNMIRRGQRKAIEQRLLGRDGFCRFQTLSIAT